MNLAVGDIVVYGMHGIGRVSACEEQLVVGVTRSVVLIELSDGLRVTLPMGLAGEQLRPLASEADLERIQQALREDRALSGDPWLSRKRSALEKLTGGDPVGLAEIVGDGAQRRRARTAKGSKPNLPSGEKEIYEKAWELLSDEISWARGVQRDEADVWINEQLAHAS